MARKSRKTAAPIEEQRQMTYNAAAYIRLSADVKRKPSDSLESQRNIIENFIAATPDIRLVNIYSDNNSTGTSFERAGFQKMITDAEAGRINCIIVKDLSRFGRNAIDAGYYLEKYLPSLNVRFIAVTDNFDSNEGDSGILLPLKNIIAESYALDISRKCKASQKQNMKDGQFVGRIAPYGFALSANDCHKLVIDEEAAAVVRQIFEWAYNGMTTGEIARNLNNAKTLPPSRYKQSKGINVNKIHSKAVYWHSRVISIMLSDRVYVGDMAQGKTRIVNHKDIPVPKSDWVIVPNTHEPIISGEIFDMVQKIRNKIAELDIERRQSLIPYTPNLFKSKVFCAKCGRLMRRNRQNKDGTYWLRCESRWKFSKDACVLVSVKESELKKELLSLLHRYSETILGGFIGYGNEMKNNNISADTELREINTLLDKDGRMLKSLYENMVNSLITKDEFVQMKADYEVKIKTLSERADEIRNRKFEAESKKTEYYDLADAVLAAISNDRLTEEIVDKLIDKILVNPDKSFEIHFKFGDEFNTDLYKNIEIN